MLALPFSPFQFLSPPVCPPVDDTLFRPTARLAYQPAANHLPHIDCFLPRPLATCAERGCGNYQTPNAAVCHAQGSDDPNTLATEGVQPCWLALRGVGGGEQFGRRDKRGGLHLHCVDKVFIVSARHALIRAPAVPAAALAFNSGRYDTALKVQLAARMRLPNAQHLRLSQSMPWHGLTEHDAPRLQTLERLRRVSQNDEDPKIAQNIEVPPRSRVDCE
jgi:hypothetical protein